MPDSTACICNIVAYYKLSNWVHTIGTPCCFLIVPVETARALQMSTAVNVITALTHRLPNKEDKLSVLVPSRAGADQVLLERMIYLFIQMLCAFTNNSCPF